jgi:hypothetical protein
MNQCDFNYSHLLPMKRGILPLDETMTKQCRRCGADFVTRSRIRKRCEACRKVVYGENQKKANERLKALRADRRLCLLKANKMLGPTASSLWARLHREHSGVPVRSLPEVGSVDQAVRPLSS